MFSMYLCGKIFIKENSMVVKVQKENIFNLFETQPNYKYLFLSNVKLIYSYE